MTRSAENTHPDSPDRSPSNAKNATGYEQGADMNPPESPALPSLEVIRDELLRNAHVFNAPTDLHLESIPGNPDRIDCLSRAHFRVRDGDRTLCRLTVATNLIPLWERTQAFAKACPDIACKPLFCHRSGEWNYLGVEFFDGQDLESRMTEGRLTAAEAINYGGKIVAALERTLQPSNVEAATQEIERLFAQVCALPFFVEFDRDFLRQFVFPFVRTGALAGPYHTRWTNGDLIPRNILVDQQGRARLVDYEFAARTHFFAEDGWRWRTFSTLPSGARDLPAFGDAELQKIPWLEGFFLLKQLVLAHETNHTAKAIADSRPTIDRLVAITAETQPGFRSSAFLQPLARSHEMEETLVKALASLREAQHQLAHLGNLLHQREKKIRIMQESFSWRITAPLRALRRALLDPHRPKEP